MVFKKIIETRLSRSFFERDTLDVAPDLLGKVLVFGPHRGIITETEAYRGADDPASHAFRGPTPRTLVMFGHPGFSYVYLIYGMYHCLNIVTEPKDTAAAVLIRGLWVDGKHLNGPGKLCRYLELDKAHNGHDLIESKNFYVVDEGIKLPFEATPRIGIKVGTEKLWRFVGLVEVLEN